jgi:hypothetical protein
MHFLCKNLEVQRKKCNFVRFLQKTMKRIFLYLLFSIGFAYAYALPVYEFDAPAVQTFQSHQIMNNGTKYNGTVYEPFSNTTPSEQSEVGSSSGYGHHGNIRRGKILGPDTPPADEYPVGEPWALAIFALAFAGVVAIRKTKKS